MTAKAFDVPAFLYFEHFLSLEGCELKAKKNSFFQIKIFN
jgi:hypothetical protein